MDMTRAMAGTLLSRASGVIEMCPEIIMGTVCEERAKMPIVPRPIKAQIGLENRGSMRFDVMAKAAAMTMRVMSSAVAGACIIHGQVVT